MWIRFYSGVRFSGYSTGLYLCSVGGFYLLNHVCCAGGGEKGEGLFMLAWGEK